MKKGFTLMEILAVLLIIAVIVSASVPIFRAIRFDVKNNQAKTATKKLAEAVRSYYQFSKGTPIAPGCFIPTAASWVSSVKSASCGNSATGIPVQSVVAASPTASAITNLFACGFLSFKDFLRSPYTYCVCDPSSDVQSRPECNIGGTEPLYAVAYGQSAELAGKKYSNTYRMYVQTDMRVQDNLN